ncbi:MAG: VWA domain-containing protein [Spirochaetota bacterium]|jgi:Ca-activated chloride channel family protein|nr:VWA domain-containing protein [Spirochaetota bacterium]
MIFQNSEYDLLFLLVPLLCTLYLFAHYAWKRYSRRVTGQDGLALHTQGTGARVALRIIAVMLAVIFLITALMRPRWGARETEETEPGIDLAVTLDISMSMLAGDILPSRLERVRSELSLLLRLLDGNRFSLVLFAGSAFIQCPLSADFSAIYEFIAQASPGMISIQGTNIEDALQKAARSLESRFKRNCAVLLISDGEAHEGDALGLAKELNRDRGIRIFTMGVGSREGSSIQSEGGEKRDKSGQRVITKLDETVMLRLAEIGNGKYYRLGNERFDTLGLVDDLNSIEKSGLLRRRAENLLDRYPVFVGMALFFFTFALLLPEKKS